MRLLADCDLITNRKATVLEEACALLPKPVVKASVIEKNLVMNALG
jgi:hypothetical protein